MAESDVRTYRRDEAACFRKTDEAFGGLSNMAPGFPIRLSDQLIRTAEALYQASRFPHLPEVQAMILRETSPMTAKMRSKPYRNESRPDWDRVRVPIMKWCLRAKLLNNWNQFSKLLLSTGSLPIVEDSRRDDFWGAIPDKIQPILTGQNVLGRLLMELRTKVHDDPESLQVLEPVQIPNFMIFEKAVPTIRRAAVTDPEQMTKTAPKRATQLAFLSI